MAIDRHEADSRGASSGNLRAGATMRGSLSAALGRMQEQVAGAVLRSATYAGARVLYDELLTRAPVGPTGNLKRAVYHWHDDKLSVNGRQVYAIGVNKAKAPHWHLVEYGHWRVNVIVRGPGGRLMATKERLPAPVWTPAHPYLRPTADRMPEAVRAMQRRLVERLREVAAGNATATAPAAPAET